MSSIGGNERLRHVLTFNDVIIIGKEKEFYINDSRQIVNVGNKIVAIQAHNQEIYVLYENSRSVGVSVYGLTREQIKKKTTWKAKGLKRCTGFVIKNDKVFIADKDKSQIRVYTLKGKVSDDDCKQIVEHEVRKEEIRLIKRNYIIVSDKDGQVVYKLNAKTLQIDRDNTRYPVMDMFCVDEEDTLWAWNKKENQLKHTKTESG